MRAATPSTIQRADAEGGTRRISLTETSGAAGRAWTDYRDRFQGVDEALGTGMVQGAIETWDRLDSFLAER